MLPGDQASAEELAAFHQSIGVPKDAKDYGALEFDGVKPDPGMDAFARKTFPEAGVTKRGAEILAKGWNKMVADTLEAKRRSDAEATAAAEQNLAREWGGKHAANLDIAHRAAAHFGLEGEQLGKLKAALGVEAASKFLLRVGQQVAADGEEPGTGGGRSSFNITTPDQAKAELGRMEKDPAIGRILTDASHAEHATVKAKWNRLLEQANS